MVVLLLYKPKEKMLLWSLKEILEEIPTWNHNFIEFFFFTSIDFLYLPNSICILPSLG